MLVTLGTQTETELGRRVRSREASPGGQRQRDRESQAGEEPGSNVERPSFGVPGLHATRLVGVLGLGKPRRTDSGRLIDY